MSKYVKVAKGGEDWIDTLYDYREKVESLISTFVSSGDSADNADIAKFLLGIGHDLTAIEKKITNKISKMM